MQSIITKYYGPGNVRGSRIVAKATGGIRLTCAYDDALSSDANHKAAAQALISKFGWYGRWHMGAADHKGAQVFVHEQPDSSDSFTVWALGGTS